MILNINIDDDDDNYVDYAKQNKTGLIYFFFLTEKHDGRMYFNDNKRKKIERQTRDENKHISAKLNNKNDEIKIKCKFFSSLFYR